MKSSPPSDGDFGLMRKVKYMERTELEEKKLTELQPIALELGISSAVKLRKQELIEAILEQSDSSAGGESAKPASATAVAEPPSAGGEGAGPREEAEGKPSEGG